MRSTWDAEGDARAVVASIVVGRATPTDPGLGSEPLHDFDVELFDGNRLAVEVARCSDPNAFGAEAEIEIARRVWLSTRLTYSWNAGFVRPIGVTSAAESLVGAVVLIEQAGLETLRLRPCFFDSTAISQMEPADRPHATRLMSAGLQDVARTWYHLGARSFVRAERSEPSVGVRSVSRSSGRAPGQVRLHWSMWPRSTAPSQTPCPSWRRPPGTPSGICSSGLTARPTSPSGRSVPRTSCGDWPNPTSPGAIDAVC